MDGELLLFAHIALINFAGKGKILVGRFKGDFIFTNDAGEKQILDGFGNLILVHIGIFDLFFNILFLIRQVFKHLAVALDIGFLLQDIQGDFDFFFKGGQILIQFALQQHAQIARCGVEALNVFHQQQRFEHPHCVWIVEMILRVDDRLLDLRPQGRANAFKHHIKRRQSAHLLIGNCLHHLLKDTQHGTFANGAIAAFKIVMLR